MSTIDGGPSLPRGGEFLRPNGAKEAVKTELKIPEQDREQARYILHRENGGKPYVSTTLNHFAAIQASTMLSGHELEGVKASIEDILNYWKTLFSLWGEGKAQPIDPQLSPKQLDKIQQSLDDCLYFEKMFKDESKTFSERGRDFGEKLQKRLEDQGECYIPSGWVAVPGHFMLCKMRIEGESVVLELLTKGGGAQFHTKVERGPHKEKVSYKNSVVVDKKLLFEKKIGQSFFEHFIQLQDDSMLKTKGESLDALDLYGLVNWLAKMSEKDFTPPKSFLENLSAYFFGSAPEAVPAVPKITLPPHEVGVTPQRSGSCKDTGVRMTFYEAIFEAEGVTNNSIAQKKRMMYGAKLESLIDAFRQFHTDLEKEDSRSVKELSYLRSVFEHALQEHMTRLNKLHPEFLNEEEFRLGLALGEEIGQFLERTKGTWIEKTLPTELPELTLSAGISVVVEEIPSIKLRPTPVAEQKADILLLPTDTPKPQEVVKTLQNALQVLNQPGKKNRQELFQQVVLFFKILPLASGDVVDDYWDKVPANERIECLHLLTELALFARKNTGSRGLQDQAEMFITASRAYDIACQLAPHIAELGISKEMGFSWSEIKARDIHFVPYQTTSIFHDPILSETLEKLQENFGKRQQRQSNNGTKGFLFPIDLPITEWRDITPKLSCEFRVFEETAHAQYVEKQFFTPEWKRSLEALKLERKLSESVLELFLEDIKQERFPASYNDLQTLSLLSAIPTPDKTEITFPITYNKENITYLSLGAERRTGKIQHWVHRGLGLSLGTDSADYPIHEGDDPQLSRFAIERKEKEFNENTLLIIGLKILSFREDEKSSLSPATLEELGLLATKKELQIEGSLHWAFNHLHLLSHISVQGYLEELIFQYGLLPKALRENGELTVKAIQNLIVKGLEYYQEHPNSTAYLWLIQLGIDLENHVKNGSEYDIELPDFYPLLEEKLNQTLVPEVKADILDLMVLSFQSSQIGEIRAEEIGRMLGSWLRRQATYGSEPTVNRFLSSFSEVFSPHLREASFLIAKHKKTIQNYLRNATKEERNLVMNRIFQELFENPLFHEDWDEKFHSKTKGFSFDIQIFKPFKDGHVIEQLTSNITSSEHYKYVFGTEPFPCTFKDGFYYRQPDGEVRVSLDGKEVTIQKKLTEDGEWFQLVSHAPMVISPKQPQYWQSVEEPSRLFLVDKSTGKFLYACSSGEGWEKVDPDTGKALATRMRAIDLSNHDPSRAEWREYLSGFDSLSNILLHETKNKDGSWEVTDLKFLNMDLSFTTEKVNGRLRLQCDQFKDLYLSDQGDKTFLSGMKGVIFLEDKEGKREKILLPARSVSPIPPYQFDLTDFTTSVSAGVKPLIPYFAYNISPHSKFVKAETAQGALYLALVYQRIGDYKAALHYLAKSHHMEWDSLVEWKMVGSMLLSNKSTSISSAAFALRVALRMEAHLKKHPRISFKQKPVEEIDKLHSKLSKFVDKQLQFYRSATSDFKEDITALDVDLRLTPRELSHFPAAKASGISLEPDLSRLPSLPVLKQRDVENLRVKIVKAKTPGYTDSALPPTFEKGMVRLNGPGSSFIFRDFFEFYNRALSTDPEERELLLLDLYFLARNDKIDPNQDESKVKAVLPGVADQQLSKKELTTFLLKALVYVAENHNDFPLLSLPNNENERDKAFLSILNKLQGVQIEDVAPTHKADKSKTTRPIPSTLLVPKHQVNLTNRLVDLKNREKIPFIDLWNRFFVSKISPLSAKAPFPLSERKVNSSLAGSILGDLKQGHAENQTKSVTSYHLQQGQDPNTAMKELKREMKTELAANESAMKELTAKIEALANQLPTAADLAAKARQVGLQVKRLTITDLIACYLTQDPSPLLKENPYLSQSDIDSLFIQMAGLFSLGRRIKLLEEALKQTNIAQIGKLLASQTAYDLEKRPAYLVYEYATGLILREDQVQLLEWILTTTDEEKLKHLLFQFQAGGGKTKVLMVILGFMLAQKGKFPILVNYSPLHEVGKHDLDSSLKAAFEQRLEVLEIELGSDISIQKLQSIIQSLQEYHQDKKCLTITSETMNALLVSRKRMFETKNGEGIEEIEKLLAVFKSPTSIALVDECRLAEDPLQEYNEAIGSPEKIHPLQQDLVIGVIDFLATDSEMQKLLQLSQNNQALVTSENFEAVKESVLQFLVGQYPEVPDLLEYLKSPVGAPRPAWLETMEDRALASGIVLTKRVLEQLLNHILHLRQGVEYGKSSDPEEFIIVPYRDKAPTTSKFQDPIVTALLTVQNLYQSGLDRDAMKSFMAKLMEKHALEVVHLTDPLQITSAQEKFNKLWGKNPPSLNHFDLSDLENITECVKRFGKNQELVKEFAREFALPQIKLYKEKLSATPPEFLEAFGRTISFSATPGPRQLYPFQLSQEGIRPDLGFESLVIETLCQGKNQQIVEVKSDTLDDFFEGIYQEDPDIFHRVTAMIDSGALFKGFSNRGVVEAFLEFAEKKGVKIDGKVFDGAVFKERGSLVLAAKDDEKHLVGSDLPKALKQVGKDFYGLMLMTLFGFEDATGADLKQRDKATALLNIGELQTKTNTIQAAMRMRRLLMGEEGQSIIWVIQAELASQIPHVEKLSVEDLFIWMIENEASILEKAIVMRAYQGIQQIVRKRAWDEILSQPTTLLKIKAYGKYRDGLVDFIEIDPYKAFSQAGIAPTEVALSQYALNCYKALGFQDSQFLELSAESQKNIQGIMAETQKLVPHVQSGLSNLSAAMHQKQEVKQEQRQEQRQEVKQTARSADQREPVKEKYDLKIWSPDFLRQTLKGKLPEEFSFLPEDIYIDQEFFKVVDHSPHPLIRPISHILVIKENGKFKYMPLSREAAAQATYELKKGHTDGDRKATLIDLHSEILVNGKGSSGLTQEELDQSEEVQGRLALILFLNGHIPNGPLLERQLPENLSLINIWKQIEEMRVGKRPSDQLKFHDLRVGRKAAEVLPPRARLLPKKPLPMRKITHAPTTRTLPHPNV